MKKPPFRAKQPAPPGASATGIVPVTREMVHQRTVELTADAGRDPRQVLQSDYERAKRELTGESDGDRQQAVLDGSAPVDPGPGATPAQAPENPDPEEDSEGRSVTEQLFDQGAEDAERDKVRRSARPSQT